MIRKAMGAVAVAGLAFALAGGCAAGAYYEDDAPCPLHPGERSVVTDEIDAAGRLTFDDAKVQALSSVARRPGLAPAEQEHLVCVTIGSVVFDDSRLRVLRTLIDNPDFGPRAKSAILHNLGAFPFDDSRTTLLRAMEGRGDAMPVPPLPAL